MAGLVAQNSRPATAIKAGRIDIHHHFQTQFVAGGGAVRAWTPARSLEQMDKFGISFAMLSHPGDGDLVMDGTEKGSTLARQINEFGAKVVSNNRQRFGLLAVLPMPDVEGSLKELSTP